jgi:putative spermidine/putrescine transport system ATP-binding protein
MTATAPPQEALRIEGVHKAFGSFVALKSIDLAIHPGELVCFLGPSGCGKTTLLRIIAGLEQQTAGRIVQNGRDVSNAPPAARDYGIVFQSYALFPNLTIRDNIAYGLVNRRKGRDAIEARVKELLTLVGLPDAGPKFPAQMSGGQQQRVALARALATAPSLLLLDEPLSALDAKIRVSLRTEIREIQRELGITTIFVTHDQEEALSISDRIVVMNGGIAEQVGSPFEVYNHPATRFVATFVGTLNTFDAKVEDGDRGLVSIAGTPVALPEAVKARAGETISVALRPERIHLGRGEGRDVVLPATIEEVHFLGSVIRLRARAAGQAIALDTFNRADVPPPAVGSQAEISLSAKDVIVLQG